MSLKNIINQIFSDNTNYLTAQQALNQARSLKSLSNDLYTDPLRFVYELIQNCDDSCQPKSILRIAIVDYRYLIVSHNGKAFDDEDVQGLCDVGCSTKNQDKQKTGYKGLGFKAVFGKSDYVLILSKGEYFRFEANSNVFKWNTKWARNQTEWEEKHKKIFEYPWQICPIWTEKDEVPESIREWFKGQIDPVGTIIRLKNIEETRHAIKQLTDDPHVFMFLRNIRSVRFSFKPPVEETLNITELRDKSLQIIYNWNPMSHWLLCPCEIDVPDHAREDLRLPEKLRETTKTEIILAAKIDKNDNIESVQGRNNALFAYLPTKITTYNLPILVNANFLTNASREHIHADSSWNQFLFSRIPHEMVKWIGKLRKQDKWCEKALDLLPNPISVKDSLAEKYNENCPKATIEVPFLMNVHKQILKISEAVIDVTGFSRPDCIGNDLIREFILRTYSPRPSIAANPFVPNSSRVRKFKIVIFDWLNCVDMLRSDEFQMNFSVEQDINFIIYLFNESRKHQNFQGHLQQIPFLMDRTGRLRMFNGIYIPSSHFSNQDWATTNDTDPYLHDSIMLWLNRNIPILHWLKGIGVIEKTDEMFILHKILPNIRTYITQENALPTIRKLFSGFQQGYVRHDLLQQLHKIKLISNEGNLVPANQLYFSDPYLPRLSLSSFQLDPGRFLSPIYLQELEGLANVIKQFFLTLGVQEDIRLIQYNDDQHDEHIAAYIYKQTETYFRYHLKNFQYRLTLPFLEITQTNINFARYFWQHIIHSVTVHQLNEMENLICDEQYFYKVNNLPYWFVRSRTCIPTTTGHLSKSTDVFSSDLRSIAGDILPVFACNIPPPFPPEWQRFFQFKTQLSLQDHLQLLTSIYDRSKQTPLTDENEISMQRIYTSLITCLLRIDRTQYNQYRPQTPFYLLSTINNEFLPSINLVVPSKDLTLSNQIPQLKLNTGNSRDAHLSQLLEFFNIKQIGIHDLGLPANFNAYPSLTLRAKLRDIQPVLFELASSQNLRDHRIDNDLEIFEVDRLELYYNETIPVLTVDIHSIGNQIYITRPWNSNSVMSKLPQILCKQFKLPFNLESNIRQLLLDDQLTTSSSSLSLDPSVDLLSLKGTREKFSMTIDRDNQQLFSYLNVNDNTTPGELLIQGLDAQTSSYSGYVYHYTHLENAVSILRDRTLKCRNLLSSQDFKDSAAKYIIETTRNNVKDYVRFYFRPLTPTQYCNENLGLPNLTNRYGNQPMCPIPIIFRIELDALLSIENLQWKISLGNLANSQTEFDNTMDIIKKFDFQGVYADICTERGKYSSQQEFLIKSKLNFDEINSGCLTIFFQDQNACDTLEQMIQLDYPSRIDESYYFGSNSRIIIKDIGMNDEINVFIQKSNPTKIYGQLILQLSGDHTNPTIEGNLNKLYQRGNILTVYSNEQFSFTTDLNNTEYTIYYEYDKQLWLIHTNSSQPEFISPIE